MDLWAFVNKHKTSESKNANLTSIKGGKWNIPPKLTKQFYKELRKASKNGEPLPPFAEKMGEYHPLVFDIDIKYDDSFTSRQYTLVALKHLLEFLWLQIQQIRDIEDEHKYY